MAASALLSRCAVPKSTGNGSRDDRRTAAVSGRAGELYEGTHSRRCTCVKRQPTRIGKHGHLGRSDPWMEKREGARSGVPADPLFTLSLPPACEL